MESGFRRDQNAIVYLMTHQGFGALKIGIANLGTGRVRAHERNGWKLFGQIELSGELAWTIENEIIAWWRIDLSLDPCVLPEDMPQGGATETVSDKGVGTEEVWSRVLHLHRLAKAVA